MDYGIGKKYKFELNTQKNPVWYTGEVLQEDEDDIQIKDRDGKIRMFKKNLIVQSLRIG